MDSMLSGERQKKLDHRVIEPQTSQKALSLKKGSRTSQTAIQDFESLMLANRHHLSKWVFLKIIPFSVLSGVTRQKSEKIRFIRTFVFLLDMSLNDRVSVMPDKTRLN